MKIQSTTITPMPKTGGALVELVFADHGDLEVAADSVVIRMRTKPDDNPLLAAMQLEVFLRLRDAIDQEIRRTQSLVNARRG